MGRAAQIDPQDAAITLDALSFGVIRVDEGCIVNYLNPRAQALTGWTSADSVGKPVAHILNILDERSGREAPNPLVTCLEQQGVARTSGESVLLSRTGQAYALEGAASVVRDGGGQVIGAVLVFHDATETRRLARRLEHEATHDTLTGLFNRREFETRLKNAVWRAREQSHSHVLCYFDLDQFKLVNDTAGHGAGDALLRRVNGLLAGLFRQSDTFARLGGDEFGLLLENCTLDHGITVGRAIVAAFARFRFPWEGRDFQVGASVGIVQITRSTTSAAQALAQADVACYVAKGNGRSQVHIYADGGVDTSFQHNQLIRVSGLQDALRENRFYLEAQPIIDLSEGKKTLAQFEILLRLCEHDVTIYPSDFIQTAERFGLMVHIDRWVIDNTLRFLQRNATFPYGMSINLSANSLNSDGFVDFLQSRIEELNVKPEQVFFEITETAAIDNIEKARSLLSEIKILGFGLSLDDFGSGLSSFRYLKYLPVDCIKIDGCFVKDMAIDMLDLHMVEAINEVGHTLGLRTVAECVETREALTCLAEIGVDMAQGYALGRPAPLNDLHWPDALSNEPWEHSYQKNKMLP